MEALETAFGAFVLDAARGRLLRDGIPVTIGQRAFVLLRALVEAGGGVVSKADLMDRAWPGAFVEEGNLTVQIAALRKALGEAPDGQAWIATVPRVGYRFVPARAPQAAEATPPTHPTLVVLPFQNLGGDPEQDWFADGVVDDIITALSRFRSFAVIARNSAFTYKGRAADVRQVTQDLGVRYVLEGSIRRSTDRLRITAQLVDGSTGAHLWSEQFDGAVADVFDFQDRITESVAVAVEPSIHSAELARARLERPGSIAAYDVHLRTLSMDPNVAISDNAAAYAMLTEALAREPDNALLLAHAAWVLDHRCAMGWPPIGPDDAHKCAELAHRGLLHAAGNPIALGRCGIALLQTAKEYDLAMAVLRSAVEANPNNLMVAIQAGVGELHCGVIADALGHFQRAMRLSPRDPFAFVAFTGIAHAQMVLGDYPEALVWATRSLGLKPSFDPTLWMLAAANAHLGRMAEARRFVADLRRLAPGVTIASIRAGQAARDPGRLAGILDGLRLAGLPEDDRDEPAIPTLAVLPFTNLGGDPGQEHFADALVTEIITALARFRSLAVVSRSSSFVYKGRPIDVREIARDLGVRYIIEGSVQRAGDQVRITAQLVDGVSGAHLWANQFDSTLDDLLDLQDQVTERVATVVEPQIRRAEAERARQERPGSNAAYDINLQALSKLLMESDKDNAEAFALLSAALERQPDNALLLAHAAWALEHRITMGWPQIAPDDRQACFGLARRGLENAAGDSTVMTHCAMALIQVAREYDWGMAVLQSAATANPNNLMVATAAGVANLHCGSVENALELFRRAYRLSPRDPAAHIALSGTAHAHMILGDYAEALVWAARSLALNANFDPVYWILTAANAHLGRMDEARRFLGELRRLAPGVTVSRIRAGQPAKDPTRIAAILEGLRLAGLEED